MQPDAESDERIVREFRANDGVVLGLPGGVVLLRTGPVPGTTAPVAALLEGGAWLVAALPGTGVDWMRRVRERPDAVVETASGSLDVVVVELEGGEARDARARFDPAIGDAPVFRLEPLG